jgi:hypothetical protein
LNTSATIKASYLSVTLSTSVSVVPPALQAVSISPTTVVGSSSTAVTGTVTLTGVSPFSSGLAVQLVSSDPGSVSVPSLVKVPVGSQSVTFTVTHGAVTTSKSVTITATYNGVSVTTQLTVTP